jgi:AcrR family transcriptional regulator
MNRQEERDRRTRAIFDTAARVLCQAGYEKASIRDIAQATGMTGAGLYYYFKSKEELLFIILDGYMDNLLQGVEELTQRLEDPEERLKAYIDFQVQTYCQDVARSKLIIHDENCLSGQWLQTLKDKQRRYLAYWRDTLAAYCQKKGLVLDHPSAHLMLLIAMCNWTYQWYDPQGPLEPQALAELIFQHFTKGLAAERA